MKDITEPVNDPVRKMLDQLGKAIVGKQQVIEKLLMLSYQRGSCSHRGLSWAWKDSDCEVVCKNFRTSVQKDSVYFGPAASRYNRNFCLRQK